jgi:hypothetical protein
MTTEYTTPECSRLSSVIEKITNDVTRALEKNLGEIIENEKNVNNCLMNIPQIKNIADENAELKKTNATLRSINKSIQEKNKTQEETIGQLQRKIKELIEKGAMLIDTGPGQDYFVGRKLLEMQKKCLIKLRKENKELKEKLNNTTTENNISLEVEEYETKKNDNDNPAEFYDKVKESEQENQILVDKIQVDNDNNTNELFEDDEEDSQTESSDDDDDDNLMLDHWKKEREKLNNMNQYVDISLEAPDDDDEEEEEEEVEEYELMINGKEYRVYRSNTGNIYEILEDDEAGELMGTINDKGEFIEL